jgi:signal transduction histidine kinase
LIKSELEDYLNNDILDNFDIIQRGGDRIIRTVDLIINLSELQAGTYTPKPEEFDLLADVISIIIANKKLMAKKNNVNLSLNYSETDLKVTADILSVTQIFEQIIDNAVKYTFNGNVVVTLQKSDNKLMVEVSDTGIGIDPKYIPNLFKPFSQEEMGYTRRFEGNGIGLALVKNYCDINNITVDVKSKKGEGSKFIITFTLNSN